MKTCRQCGNPVKRAGLCGPCRRTRRREQWRKDTAKYVETHQDERADSVLRWQDRRRAPTPEEKDEMSSLNYTSKPSHFVVDTPLLGRRTPAGPNEGVSTRDPELMAQLDQLAAEAASHEWWSANPDALRGV